MANPSSDKPVWLNESTTLYTVVLKGPEGRFPILVLTDGGPIKAGKMGEEATGLPLLKSQHWPFPFLVPDISEVVHMVEEGSAIAQKHPMTLYRFALDNGQTCLVWTKGTKDRAAQFAEVSTRAKVTDTFIVTNPVLVDTDAEKLLANA